MIPNDEIDHIRELVKRINDAPPLVIDEFAVVTDPKAYEDFLDAGISLFKDRSDDSE